MLPTSNPSAIVIGASAGAVEALSFLFSELPSSFPLPIFVVVHVPPRQDNELIECLQSKTGIRIVEVEDKTEICRGTIYIAPADYHLLVEDETSLSLTSEEPVHYSRPSIDVLFESAADAYGEMLLGIVLTGGNSDGADGLSRIVQMGGTAIVQDPQTARVSIMPEAALQACPQALVMTLAELASHLQKIGGS